MKIVESILQSYCEVKLEAILVDPEFQTLIEQNSDRNNIPKYKLETALSKIDGQAFSFSDTIEKIIVNQKPLKVICKLIKEGFVNPNQT